jgi:hypothetical protein
LSAGIRDQSGQHATAVRFEEPFRVDVEYKIRHRVENAAVLVSFVDLAGNLIFESWDTDASSEGTASRQPGNYQASCLVPQSLLKPGRYWLNIAAHVPNRKILDRRDHVIAFDVLPPADAAITDRLGLLSPVLPWETHTVGS